MYLAYRHNISNMELILPILICYQNNAKYSRILDKSCFQNFNVKARHVIKKIKKRCYRDFALELVKQTSMFFIKDQSLDAE